MSCSREGRLIFNVWDRIETVPVIEAAVAALRRRHPETSVLVHGARALAATTMRSKIRADLDAAGFTDCVIETVALAGHAPDARGPALGMCQGSPLGAEIETLEPAAFTRRPRLSRP